MQGRSAEPPGHAGCDGPQGLLSGAFTAARTMAVAAVTLVVDKATDALQAVVPANTPRDKVGP